jgi:hypothetical protein
LACRRELLCVSSAARGDIAPPGVTAGRGLVREGTARPALRASGSGARRRLALLHVLDQLTKSPRSDLEGRVAPRDALRERVGAGEAQLGRRGAHVTPGEHDHSAVFAVAAQDGLDGEAGERPQLAELVFGAAHRGARRN